MTENETKEIGEIPIVYALCIDSKTEKRYAQIE